MILDEFLLPFAPVFVPSMGNFFEHPEECFKALREIMVHVQIMNDRVQTCLDELDKGKEDGGFCGFVRAVLVDSGKDDSR